MIILLEIILNDWANGASMFNLMILYVEEILNKIKFAEDLMVKLYIVDNRKVHFYYENVAFY